MGFWLVEALCVVLMVLGIVLAFKRPSPPPAGRPPVDASQNPRTYILRIAGVMLGAFGLALGTIVGVFHFV